MGVKNMITAKGWLKYHPYTRQVATDFYYIKLCSKVLDIIKSKKFNSLLISIDEKTELAYTLVAYFEDVVSETRIFTSFTEQHYQLYGKYLPFYDINPDEYYTDEVNLQDISFLIWHFQAILDFYDLDIISDPFRQTTIELSEKIYDLFETEFENAPQNEDLQNFFLDIYSKSPALEIRKRIEFIACNSYFNAPVFNIFMQDEIDNLKHEIRNNPNNEDKIFQNKNTDLILYDAHLTYIFNETSPLLSLHAKEILGNMLGEKHPAYKLIQKISTKKNSFFLYKKEEETFYIFKHIFSRKTIHLSKECCTFEKDSLIPDQSVFLLNIVQWENMYQLVGANIGYDVSIEELCQTNIGAGIFNEKEDQLKIINEQEKAFLSINKNKHITYVSSPKELKILMRKINITQLKESHPHLTDEKINEYAEVNLDRIISSLGDFQNVVFFFNPLGGMEFYPDFAVFINDKKNRFYDKSALVNIESILLDETYSKEYINYLINNSLINLQVDSQFENGNELELISNNFDFLLRYYKRNHYWTKPQITIMDK